MNFDLAETVKTFVLCANVYFKGYLGEILNRKIYVNSRNKSRKNIVGKMLPDSQY
jgi:hypothetical protein